MSHYVSIWNSLLRQSYHHLARLNSYTQKMQIPLLIDCAPKFPHMLCTACDFSHTPRTQPVVSHTRLCTYDRSNSRPNRPCHALIPVFNSLTSDRSRGGSRGDFNTKSLPLSLPACVTAYQRPLSDVGNPGPCPPNPCSQAACLVQTKLKTTGQAQLGLTSMRRRSLYAHFAVRRREAWKLISRPSLLICFLPLSTSHHASCISGLSIPLR